MYPYSYDDDRQRTCPVCGKEFYKGTTTRKYCSRVCLRRSKAHKTTNKSQAIEDVCREIKALSKRLGRSVSYGEYVSFWEGKA